MSAADERPASSLVVSGTLTLDTTEHAGAVHADVPGGSALYGAAAGSLLLPTRIVGTVGDDFPFDNLSPLWTRGVDRSAIEVLGGPTFRWHARYEPDGEQRTTLLRDRGVAEGRLPPVPTVELSNYVLLLGSTEPRVQAHVRAACGGAQLVGLDSMAHWWTDQPQAMRELLARVDVLFVDEGELQLATGCADATRAVVQLLARGPSLVVVKRGARGAWMTRRGQAPIETAAVALAHVTDTTGAGDAFAGACMAALGSAPARGDAYALRFATAVASCAVESVGIGGLLRATHEEIARRMQGLAQAELGAELGSEPDSR